MISHVRFFLIAAASGVLASAAIAGGLTGVSPFLPSDSAAAGAASEQPVSLELRGLMAGPEGALYCLYDTEKNRCFWLAPNQAAEQFAVLSGDVAAGTVKVRLGDNRVVILKLREAKIHDGASGPEAAAGLNIDSVQTMPMRRTIPPPPETEADRRWDKIQEEAEQRRVAMALQAAVGQRQ
jgi:hypothetical protein